MNPSDLVSGISSIMLGSVLFILKTLKKENINKKNYKPYKIKQKKY